MIIEGVLAAFCSVVTITAEPMVPVIDDTVSFVELNKKLYRDGRQDTTAAVAAYPKVVLSECNMTVSYARTTLYIASEMKRSNCAFNHLMKHELGHVAIYNVALRRFDRTEVAVGQHLAAAERFFDETRKLHEPHDEHISRDNARVCRRAVYDLVGM